MSIQVLKLRGSCHLQDAGRVGQAHSGMPRGGFADTTSAALANLIVGKKAGATVLECTLGGPDLRFETTCEIALTGANVLPKLNGKPVPMWQRIHVYSGATLTCSHARNGLRTCIALSRSIREPKWRASVSPVLVGEVHYPSTSVLVERSKIQLGGEVTSFPARVVRAYVHVPEHLLTLEQNDEIRLQLHAAPESALLLENAAMLHAFENSTWEISPQSNRMGVRLIGPSLPLGKTSGLMRSGPVLPGTVQLLPDGQLIITHVDSQTIGGYPRIGVVDRVGLSVLAQAEPKRSLLRLCY